MGQAWGGVLPTDDPQRKPGAADLDSSYAATPLTHRVTNVGSGPFRLLAISVKDNAPVVHTGELPGRLEATSSWFRWSRVELAAGHATAWFTATSPTLVVQPQSGEGEVTTAAGAARLTGPGAWTLVEPGQRYRIHNPGAAATATIVIQVP
jgi:quercetin dioxygenase-like cupin family protein